MFSTQRFVRTAPSLLTIIGIFSYMLLAQNTYALELPFVGKVTFGPDEDTASENMLNLDVLFGYRAAPQYYTANQDTVEVRGLVVNNESTTQSGQFETKIYRVTALWDTETHEISFDERFDYINADPEDELNAFSEGTLRDIFLDTQDCSIREDEFCYQNANAEDNDRPFGGITLESKPVYANISEDIVLDANARVNNVVQWQPKQCGYYRLVMQPLGYIELFGEENRTKDAFIRVRGCERGEILDDGASITIGSPDTGIGDTLGTVDTGDLPATANGLLPYILPAIGLLVGGTLVHTGMRRNN